LAHTGILPLRIATFYLYWSVFVEKDWIVDKWDLQSDICPLNLYQFWHMRRFRVPGYLRRYRGKLRTRQAEFDFCHGARDCSLFLIVQTDSGPRPIGTRDFFPRE
jgi:hypothetical protein